MSRGHDRERDVKRILEADGWLVVRAAGSLGVFDLVALKRGFPPRVVEVKTDVRGPFANFRPEDRARMLDAAYRAGAEAWLAYQPPRRRLEWIFSEDWPAMPGQVAA